ncbi:hypothetical protein SISNIDRAFT_164194 [Sistotremastrum niveocremeum HHB9708]|uniref:Uncharacterized protein n=1 Tax=Sistotremastrum niveocremeum HHB9708 TaxID=1314777 RepID=A0A164SF78_9AGAM|nr:hypothetical protein SISNIDRAFT_164194 [Sistotremastrum niveocremeum HHB9708]
MQSLARAAGCTTESYLSLPQADLRALNPDLEMNRDLKLNENEETEMIFENMRHTFERGTSDYMRYMRENSLLPSWHPSRSSVVTLPFHDDRQSRNSASGEKASSAGDGVSAVDDTHNFRFPLLRDISFRPRKPSSTGRDIP